MSQKTLWSPMNIVGIFLFKNEEKYFFFFYNYIEFWEKLLFFPPFLHSVLIGCCSQLWGYLYGSGWVRVLQPPVLVLLWAVLQLSGCLPTF